MTDIPEDVREAMARAHWNENPTAARITTWFGEGTASGSRVSGYVLWDDEDMSERDREAWRAKIDAALSALREAGWAVVPAEATDDMVRAGRDTCYSDGSTSLYVAWRAMIAAAPPAPSE